MRFLTENIGWKLFSVAIAIFLWVTFAQDAELAAFVSAPVEFKSMPEELEISSDVVDSVTMEVRGSADIVREFHSSPTSVVLDFSTIHGPGEQTFQIDDHNVRLPSGLRLVRVVPAQIRFRFERRLERDIPIRVRFLGNPASGYSISHYEVQPETVEVVGPAGRVSTVEFAETDPIDVSHVVSQTEFHVNAFIHDPHVRFSHPARIAVRVFVERK